MAPSDKSWATRPTKLPKPGIWAPVDEDSLNLDNSFIFNNASVFENNDSLPAMHDLESIHSRVSVASSTTSNTYLTYTAEPLSWHGARSVMRDVLTRYMDSSDSNDACGYHGEQESSSLSLLQKIDNFWFTHDLDCYLGSILISLVLLVLSIVLYIQERQSQNESNGNISKTSITAKKLHISHITASVLLLFGSILSVWLLHRRRFISARGTETKKRNTIASFLPLLDEMRSHSDGSSSSLPTGYENLEATLPGTSLTDIYPVYRLSSAGDGKGRWHKVPSLLLVEGDFIALQIGDIAPANCKLVAMGASQSASALRMMSALSAPNLRAMGSGIGSQHTPKVPKEPLIIKGGDRVQIPQKLRFENRPNVQICDPLFLPGKSKVPDNSRKLLHLNNRSKVFQVLDSPIESYLRKKIEPKKKPQAQRKLQEVRTALYCFSICSLIISYIIIFIRHSIQEVHYSIIMNLPLLAALGSLPVATPLVAILLEIIGTSQILVTVHPYASHVRIIERKSNLFLQYFLRGLESRIQFAKLCQKQALEQTLIDFPVASLYLYEKLGVVTALSLIDDELACDPVSTPQQLLVPTSNGLKLLDLFPKYEEDSDDDSSNEEKSHASSNDSDSDWGDEPNVERAHNSHNGSHRVKALINIRKRYKKRNLSTRKFEAPKATEVQFEDPNWWHYLPSLKCIGLASLLVDNKRSDADHTNYLENGGGSIVRSENNSYIPGAAESSLARHVSQYYNRSHLRILSHCIGFTIEANSFGGKGDITPLKELRRIRIIATRLVHSRMVHDRHQISLEESRSWGLLRPDSTSVVIQDSRSQAYQLLTVGDARVVTDICSDLWQGESITPLSPKDRATILENSNTWSLADLDVTAFSYAPIPFAFGEKLGCAEHTGRNKDKTMQQSVSHLIDNRTTGEVPASLHKESGPDDWSLVQKQIFLGLLGSSVSPRRDVAGLIEDCARAGVRFVYFSPRNMRRTKELASQMGIDISWNCAISLRPLDEGEEADEHRMTSNYADWDVNARLPHGVEAVKRHLEDVDNVPLLVSLFTDVTRTSTSEMINVFKSYHDTVLSLGLSHISQNDSTFTSSDLAFGIDILFQANNEDSDCDTSSKFCSLSHHRKELLFVSKIASNFCVFNLAFGQSGLLNMAEILGRGRGALTSGTSSGYFVIYASVVYTLTITMCTLSASTPIPVIPASAVILYIQVFVPLIALSMAFSREKEESMTIVPPKNDPSITFGNGRSRAIMHMVIRSLIPAGASGLVFLISFGELVKELDPEVLESLNLDSSTSHWTSVMRCDGLSTYVGQASLAASSLMLSELALCVIVQSTSFLFGNDPISNPIRKNLVWTIVSLSCVAIVILYLNFVLPAGSLQALPWYFYLIALTFPLISLAICEVVKKKNKHFEQRSEKLRRLQFETRLGMWSPK